MDDVWLPRRTETLVTGRVLLLKGFRERVIEEYDDYQRFGVTTEERTSIEP